VSSGQITRRAEFEKLGKSYARMCAARGGDAGFEASAWLAEQQELFEMECAAKRDAREEETLAIAKEANRHALVSNTIARRAVIAAYIAAIAAIIAAAMAAIANKASVFEFIFGP
jgi:hypothetical protein